MKVKQLKSKFNFSIIILLSVHFLACSNGTKYNESIAIADNEINESFEATQSSNQDAVINRSKFKSNIPNNLKIIKSAKAKYKVSDVKNVTKLIKSLAAKNQAYISDLRFENNLYKKENRFTIKIPSHNFDVMMDSISSFVDFVDYENITTKDVTEEFIDLEVRVKTKQEVKQRYESILRKNAKTVKDILLTEEKLRVIQEEIEAAQGRLKFLSNKVAYSTIQIGLYETVSYKKEPVSYQKTLGSKIKEAFSFGWGLFESILLGMLHLWPLLIVLVVVLIFLKKRMIK